MSNKHYSIFSNLATKVADGTSDAKIVLARLKMLCEEDSTPSCIIILDDNMSIWLNHASMKLSSSKSKNLTLQEAQQFMPDYYANQFIQLVTLFNNPVRENEVLQYFNCFQINRNNVIWMYTCSKLVYTSPDKDVKYILVMGVEAEEFIQQSEAESHTQKNWLGISEWNTAQDRLKLLSKREMQVLQLIHDEHTSVEIAEILFVSKSSVDAYRKSMLKKLEVKNAIGLLKYAMLMNT